jgi:uncharacterized protein involved in exopolysaccharide biosynthesis
MMNSPNALSAPIVVLRRHSALAIIVFLVLLGAGILAGALLPVKYTSAMKILVLYEPPESSQRAGGVAVGQVSEEEVNSEVELLTSYTILNAAVLQNRLAHPSKIFHRSEQEDVDAAVRRLGKDLDVTPVRKANIIEVNYSDSSPQLAASVLRSIETGYVEAHLQAQATPGGYEFFKGQVAHSQKELTEAQNALATFSLTQDAANLDQQRSLLTQAISEQETTLQQTEAALEQVKMEIRESAVAQKNLAPRLSTSKKSEPNQYSIDHLTTLLADLNNERIQLRSKYLDSDELVRLNDDKITATRQALRNAESRSSLEETTDVNPILQTIQSGLETKKIELAGLNEKLKVQKQQLSDDQRKLNQLTKGYGQYEYLTNTANEAQMRYDEYVRRQEQARVSESLDRSKITNVRITQKPTESLIRSSPRMTINVLLAFAFAFFASITAVVLAEYFTSATPEVVN